MTGSRLLLGVASVLAGTTVLLGVFGFVYNPVLLVAAVPFAAATYLLWSHGTGRLEARMRERIRVRQGEAVGGPFGGDGSPGARNATQRGTAWRPPADGGRGPSRRDEAAARILGVAPDADDATIRRAFRDRAKSLHPDAPEGDEAAFRRARAAYEHLTGRR